MSDMRLKTMALTVSILAAAARPGVLTAGGLYSSAVGDPGVGLAGRHHGGAPQLQQLVLIIHTAHSPAVAQIAYTRALRIDPHNAQVRAAMARRMGRSYTGVPAESDTPPVNLFAPAPPVPSVPATKAAAPAPAEAAPVRPPPRRGPGAATLQRQRRGVLALIERIEEQMARLNHSMASNRGSYHRPVLRPYYFRRYVMWGPVCYPYPYVHSFRPVTYSYPYCGSGIRIYGSYSGGHWRIAGSIGGGYWP